MPGALRPLVNDAYLTLQPYVPGKPVSETERELGITGAIKLASNENPLGPSPKATAAIADYLPHLNDYPDGACYYLRGRMSAFLGVAPESLIFANGTNEIIELLIRTCIRPGENMVYGAHAFVIYKLCAQAAGVPIRTVPFSGLRHDLSATARAIDAHTKLVFIDNPNNPTGTYVNRAEVEAFLRDVPPDVVVVLDEAYFEYATASDYPNGLEYLGRRERLLVMRTFSKAYGLAGVRLGYAVGHPSLVDMLNRGRQPFNVSSVAQVAGLAAIDDQEHVRRGFELNRDELPRVRDGLRAMGLTVPDSQANFVLADFGRPVMPIFEASLRQGVIIRPVVGYGLPNHARISIGTRQQNDRLLATLTKVLG